MYIPVPLDIYMTKFMYTLAAEPAVPGTIRTYRYQDSIKHEQVGETDLSLVPKTSKAALSYGCRSEDPY